MRVYLLATVLAVGALSLADCGTTPACRAESRGLAGADRAQHWVRLVAMPGWVPWSAA